MVSPPARTSRDPGVLVVDADPTTRQLLREFLASGGFRSEEASDASAALASVGGGNPAAVVLHDHVPGAQGLEILRTLRAHHPELPVVFIAEMGDREARAEVGQQPGTAWLDKPFGIGDLLATVVRAVDRPAAGSRRRVSGRRRVATPAGGTRNGRGGLARERSA